MVDFETQYRLLIKRILREGHQINPSKGGCREVHSHFILLEPETVPLLSSRKIYYKGLVGELKAFLNNAQTDEEFKAYGCNFWGAWTGKEIDYSRLLHNFNGVNQIERVIDRIITKPHSRKNVISLWDPSSDTLQPPCVMHYQWLVEGSRLNMIWSQRSADVMVGLASDMFSAWLFNQVMAKLTDYKPGNVYIQIGSAHIYDVHNPQLILDREYIENDINYKLEVRSYKDFDFTIDESTYIYQRPIRFELCI